MHHIALCCLEGSTSKDGFIFYHGLNGLNEVVLWRKEEIKTKQLPLAVQNEPPAEATDDYLRPARSLSSGVLPSRQRFSGRVLIRGRCHRLLRVVPSRHRSACGYGC